MTQFMPGMVIIEPQEPEICNMCGELRELRPYGPPETPNICFPCGMSTPEMEKLCAMNFYAMVFKSIFDGTPHDENEVLL